MNVKENISAKFGICKSGDLLLTRRSRRLRRTFALQISMVLAQTTLNRGTAIIQRGLQGFFESPF